MQVTSIASVSYMGYTAKEWEIHDTAYLAGYKAAREDAEEENKQRRKIYRLKQAVKRQRKLCNIKQKVIGLLLAVVGVLIPFLLDGDITVSVLIILLGLYMAITRELVICDGSTERLRELKRELREEREVAQW